MNRMIEDPDIFAYYTNARFEAFAKINTFLEKNPDSVHSAELRRLALVLENKT